MECVARYSKVLRPPLLLLKAVKNLDFEPPGTADRLAKLPPRQRVADRLTDRDVEEILAGYRGGLTTRELADQYSLGKTAIQRLLLDADVPMRKQPLTGDDVALAAELYHSGLSLAAVAEQLETHPSTIWRTLTRAGVRLRRRGGR